MSNHQTTQPAKMPTSVAARIAEAISPMELTVDEAVAIADAIHQPVEDFLIGSDR